MVGDISDLRALQCILPPLPDQSTPEILPQALPACHEDKTILEFLKEEELAIQLLQEELAMVEMENQLAALRAFERKKREEALVKNGKNQEPKPSTHGKPGKMKEGKMKEPVESNPFDAPPDSDQRSLFDLGWGSKKVGPCIAPSAASAGVSTMCIQAAFNGSQHVQIHVHEIICALYILYHPVQSEAWIQWILCLWTMRHMRW